MGEMNSVRTPDLTKTSAGLSIERGAISVACNFSEKSQMVSFGEDKFLALLLSYTNAEISGGGVILPPDSVAILKRGIKF